MLSFPPITSVKWRSGSIQSVNDHDINIRDKPHDGAFVGRVPSDSPISILYHEDDLTEDWMRIMFSISEQGWVYRPLIRFVSQPLRLTNFPMPELLLSNQERRSLVEVLRVLALYIENAPTGNEDDALSLEHFLTVLRMYISSESGRIVNISIKQEGNPNESNPD